MSIFTAPSSTTRISAADTFGGGLLTLVSASTGLPLNMPKGALIICMVTSSDPSEPTDPFFVMADDVLNEWLYGGKFTNANGMTQYCFYVLSNVTAARNTVFVFGNGNEDFYAAYLTVIPITAGYATFDTAAFAGGTSGTTATTATYNTATADECALCVCASQTSSNSTTFYTAATGAGWTSESRNYGTTGASGLITGEDVIAGSLSSG